MKASLCWIFTRHAQTHRWGRYDIDASGTACWCWRHRSVDGTKVWTHDFGRTWGVDETY